MLTQSVAGAFCLSGLIRETPRQKFLAGLLACPREAMLPLRPRCRGGGMADATDLKSVDRKVVRVRLPPSAPSTSIPKKVKIHHRIFLIVVAVFAVTLFTAAVNPHGPVYAGGDRLEADSPAADRE